MMNIDFQNLSPVVGCPLKSPQGTIPETLTCHIYIYDHIYIEVALGQDCQMYNKLAAPCITNWQQHGSGLPYNISSSERVKCIYMYLVFLFNEQNEKKVEILGEM